MACTRRHYLLAICILQMLTIIERQVMDFLGFMWAPILVNFFHIIFVIFGFFGAYQLSPKYIGTYSIWNVIFIGWNAFLICFYLNVGVLDRESDLINLGTGSFSWFLVNGYGCKAIYSDNITTVDDPYRPRRPETVENCLVDYFIVEVVHAAVQCLLALLGIIGGIAVGRIFLEDDDRFHYLGGDVKSPQDTVVHPMYVSYNSLPTANATTPHQSTPTLFKQKKLSYFDSHKNFVNFNPNENLMQLTQPHHHNHHHNQQQQKQQQFGDKIDNSDKNTSHDHTTTTLTNNNLPYPMARNYTPPNPPFINTTNNSIVPLSSSLSSLTRSSNPGSNKQQALKFQKNHNRLSGSYLIATPTDPNNTHSNVRYQELVKRPPMLVQPDKRNSLIGTPQLNEVSYYTNEDPVDLVDLYPSKIHAKPDNAVTDRPTALNLSSQDQFQAFKEDEQDDEIGDQLPAYNSFNRANILVNQKLKQTEFYKMPTNFVPRSPNLSHRSNVSSGSRRNQHFLRNTNFCDQIRTPPGQGSIKLMNQDLPPQPPRAKSQNQLPMTEQKEPSQVNSMNRYYVSQNNYKDIDDDNVDDDFMPPPQRADSSKQNVVRKKRPRSYCSSSQYQE